MAAQPDQMLLYDTAVRQWVLDTFSNCIAGKSFNLMVGTPDRAFAQFVTPTGLDPDGRPPLPRAALTLGDPEIDPERFNPSTLRKLGYVDATNISIRQAEYPVPIRIPYSLNFWAEYRREMTLFMQELLKQFRFQYKYISVDLDSISPVPVYGTKLVGMFQEGAVVATGDVEPGNKEKVSRRTFDFHLRAWIWDFNFTQKFSVREIVTRYYEDEDFTLLFETRSTPQTQTLVSGVDGVQTSFVVSVDPSFLPIIKNTFLVDATVASVNVRGRDDGAGALNDPGGVLTAGTVNYDTGAVTLTYATAPDSGTDILVKYFTTVD